MTNSFSPASQTAEQQVPNNTGLASVTPDDIKRHNLLAQLEFALREFDDNACLRVLTLLESLDSSPVLRDIRRAVEAFEFTQGLAALDSLRQVAAPERFAARKPVILAVDDMPNNLAILKSFLNGPYRFVGVTSGEEALQYLEINIPDVYILDIVMPNMDGFELVEQIHRKRKFAPVIFLTASATAEYVARAFNLGVTDFLVKPYNKEAVQAKIKRLLGV